MAESEVGNAAQAGASGDLNGFVSNSISGLNDATQYANQQTQAEQAAAA